MTATERAAAVLADAVAVYLYGYVPESAWAACRHCTHTRGHLRMCPVLLLADQYWVWRRWKRGDRSVLSPLSEIVVRLGWYVAAEVYWSGRSVYGGCRGLGGMCRAPFLAPAGFHRPECEMIGLSSALWRLVCAVLDATGLPTAALLWADVVADAGGCHRGR